VVPEQENDDRADPPATRRVRVVPPVLLAAISMALTYILLVVVGR
jgi:hypothetical protein